MDLVEDIDVNCRSCSRILEANLVGHFGVGLDKAFFAFALWPDLDVVGIVGADDFEVFVFGVVDGIEVVGNRLYIRNDFNQTPQFGVFGHGVV